MKNEPRGGRAQVGRLLAVAVIFGGRVPPVAGTSDAIRSAVVKIYVTTQAFDYEQPWQARAPASGVGSGFLIARRRILTNAHLVSNAKFIEVQKDGAASRYPARVEFVAHDCDVATLRVEDPAWFADTRPLSLARRMPKLQDEVTVYGYPLGGTRLSVTRGVVSRIDYGTYTHSGVDQHLVLQVDAAINPGNSGGPIVMGGRVVGLAFQGLAMAENIGYGIPLPVLERFLRDIEDGTYEGYPELGVSFLETRNPALRRSLGLPLEGGGVVVFRVDPFGAAAGHLADGDVLLRIDGRPIASDGTIRLDGEAVLFAELLERKQWGEWIELDVSRSGRLERMRVPLTNLPDPFAYRNLYDEPPRYGVLGGLVFTPLNREVLRSRERGPLNELSHQLFYYAEYGKIDGLIGDRQEFVVLVRRLPHAVNTYAEAFLYGIVEEVNGRRIRRLEDVTEAAAHPIGGFHVIRLAHQQDRLILDAEAVRRAEEEIALIYGLPRNREQP